jgi:hypothetical protein
MFLISSVKTVLALQELSYLELKKKSDRRGTPLRFDKASMLTVTYFCQHSNTGYELIYVCVCVCVCEKLPLLECESSDGHHENGTHL